MYQLSKRSLERLKNVNPLLIAIAVDAIRESPYDFGIPQHGGKRTADEQNLLYNQIPRVSWKDGFIKKSYHQTGRAFDIFIIVDCKATWEHKYYKEVSDHIISIARKQYDVDLKWGGDWKMKDLPHFQF